MSSNEDAPPRFKLPVTKATRRGAEPGTSFDMMRYNYKFTGKNKPFDTVTGQLSCRPGKVETAELFQEFALEMLK